MLSQLNISNFQLIDRLSVDFSDSLNIFTGETGAGKSLLIDALRFALGERFSTSQLWDKAKPCTVEALFELSADIITEFHDFTEFLQDEETQLIILRTVSPDGKNKIKINGTSVTVSQLRTLGNYLVDFHGPNDHQMLLSADSHIDILDRLCDMHDMMKEYTVKYNEYVVVKNQLKQLEGLKSSRDRDIDLLSHQIKELEQVPLSDENYEELLSRQIKMDNAEKIYTCVNELLEYLDNEQYGVSESILKSFNPMEKLNNVDESTLSFKELLDDMQEKSDVLLENLREYADSLSFEPHEASEVSSMIDVYSDIKRKYGPTIMDAQAYYKDAKKKYDMLVDLEHNDKALRDDLSKKTKSLKTIAAKITDKRKKVSILLKNTIEKELKELGIKHIQFESKVSQSEVKPNGTDDIVFYISPNAGEELKPLAEIVSSGEASRMMLALKKALTKVDPIPTLIFDEIDAQIGGRLGDITGKKLKEISQDRQVILITHLPQIASFGDTHFKVEKSVQNGRTTTSIHLLSGEERVRELAQMMSGEKESTISLEHARSMLSGKK